MLIDKETLRLIFGLKLRSLREEKNYSLKDLAKISGLSPSYLNEIEKGKKYPKTEKIILLSEALDVHYDELISLELKKELKSLQNLMDRKVLKVLPLDVFGIPMNMLFDLIAENPDKVSALIGTILEISRAHNIQIDDIFYALLRSYLDMNGNYFVDLEEETKKFHMKFPLNFNGNLQELKEYLISLLKTEFKVKVLEEELIYQGRKLDKILYYIEDEGKKLHLSNDLGIKEQNFILAREIGFHFLKIRHRPKSSMIRNLDSYEQLFNHFKASYFASSLLISEDKIVKHCSNWFLKKEFSLEDFKSIIEKYPLPPESVFYRLTQILPTHFKLQQLFFLRYEFDQKLEKYEIARELHLSSIQGPHRIKGNEHYCARWLVSKITQSALTNVDGVEFGIQRSNFIDSNQEYLILGVAFRPKSKSEKLTSICLGLKVDESLKSKINFLNDPKIKLFEVGETCERCSLANCSERRASQELPFEFL